MPALVRTSTLQVYAVVAVGGAFGASARHALETAFPHQPAGFGWATFGINVVGCAFIGVLMVLVEHVWIGRRLLRPFVGVGVLGGFTTFSTYVLDTQQAFDAGAPGTALIYLAATPVAALAALWLAFAATVRLAAIETGGHRPRSRKGADHEA